MKQNKKDKGIIITRKVYAAFEKHSCVFSYKNRLHCVAKTKKELAKWESEAKAEWVANGEKRSEWNEQADYDIHFGVITLTLEKSKRWGDAFELTMSHDLWNDKYLDHEDAETFRFTDGDGEFDKAAFDELVYDIKELPKFLLDCNKRIFFNINTGSYATYAFPRI